MCGATLAFLWPVPICKGLLWPKDIGNIFVACLIVANVWLLCELSEVDRVCIDPVVNHSSLSFL